MRRAKKSKAEQDILRRPPCVKETMRPGKVSLLFQRRMLEGLSYVKDKDQNFTVLCAGVTGGGKSSLGIHANLLVDSVDFERYAFDQPSTADSYKAASDEAKRRYDFFYDKFLVDGVGSSEADRLARRASAGVFWNIDELKAYSAQHASKFNTEFFSLLQSVRFKNLFTWMNAPSIRAIDRRYIEEQIFDAFIFIYAAQSRFWYFTFKQFQRLVDDVGSYDIPSLLKFGDRFADFDGYFSRVPRVVEDEYVVFKRRLVEGVDERFIENFGSDSGMNLKQAMKALDIKSNHTFKTYFNKAVEQGLVNPSDCKTGSGNWKLSDDHIMAIKQANNKLL